MEKEVLVITCRWDQRGEGNHSMLPGTDLGMKLGGLDLRNIGGVCFCLQPTCCHGGSSPWVSRGLAAGVGVWDKARSWAREVRRERSVRSIGVGVSEAGKATKGLLLMTGVGNDRGRSYWGEE